MKIYLQIEHLSSAGWIKLETNSYAIRYCDCDMLGYEYKTNSAKNYLKNNKRFLRWFFT